ncbi:MAG: tyrosine recombinase [Actinomycetes bacterium]
MNLSSASRDFLLHLQVERGLAANTISAYKRDLFRLEEFLVSTGTELGRVDPSTIASFAAGLKSDGLVTSSISRSMSTLRTFFLYCAKEYSLDDPMVEIEKSKQIRKLPKALSISEVLSILEASHSESDLITLRDRALIEMLYGSGARISEVVGLDVSDIHTADADGVEFETIKVRGKGGKERIVPLGSFASNALRAYIVRVRPSLAAKSSRASSALFLNQKGTRLSRQSAWQFVLNAAKKSGLEGKVSPHVFRHSYATHLLDGGADIRVVQELLGHASVTTTQIYTLITIDKVRESYSLAHPRARG